MVYPLPYEYLRRDTVGIFSIKMLVQIYFGRDVSRDNSRIPLISDMNRDDYRNPLLRDMSRDGCKNLSSRTVCGDTSRSIIVESS